MYNQLSDSELEFMEEVSNITDVDYEITDNFIPVENFISALKDLKLEYEMQKERYEKLQQNLEDNYRPITPGELGWDID